MAEPTSLTGISLATLAIAMLGPLAGPYALILFAALAGSLWPLSAATTLTRVDGGWLVLRCTMTSVVLTGMGASFLHSQWGIQANESVAPVAFIFAALGNGWRAIIDTIGNVISTVLTKNATKDKP